MLNKFSLIVFTFLFSVKVFALPIAAESKLEIRGDDDQVYDFEGIVKLSNCSGSLIHFEGQSLDNKAIVMTNGHCIQKPGGYLNPGEVWVNKANTRAMKIFDKNKNLHAVQATKILYATLTDTDVALYELSESYNVIKNKAGINALTLAADHPVDGIKIEIISGYWDRGFNCSINGFVETLKEGAWLFTDSIRYTTDGCKTMGGTSGSPIIESGTKMVVGINNTHNEQGERCTLNNPCEVSRSGEVYVQQGLRYGQQTHQFYGCMTEEFSLDLSLSTCALPKP